MPASLRQFISLIPMNSAIESVFSNASGPMALAGMFGSATAASARNNFAATFGAQLSLPMKTEVIPSGVASSSQALVGGGQPGSIASRKGPGKSSSPPAASSLPFSSFLPTSPTSDALQPQSLPNFSSAFTNDVTPVDVGTNVIAHNSEIAALSLPSSEAVTAPQGSDNFARVSLDESATVQFSLNQSSPNQSSPSLSQQSSIQVRAAISPNSPAKPAMLIEQPPENNLTPTAETIEITYQNPWNGTVSSGQTAQQAGSAVGNSQPPTESNAVLTANFTVASVIASSNPTGSLIAQLGPTPVQSQSSQSSTPTQSSTPSKNNNASSAPSPSATSTKLLTSSLPRLAGDASSPAAALPPGVPASIQLQPRTGHAGSTQSNDVIANLPAALRAHVAATLVSSSLELRQSLPLSVGPSMPTLQPKVASNTSTPATTIPASQLGESSAPASTALASPNPVAASDDNQTPVRSIQGGASGRDSQSPTTAKQNVPTNQSAVIAAPPINDMPPGSAQPATTVAADPTLQATAGPAPAAPAGKSSGVPANSSDSTPNPSAVNDLPSPQTAGPVQMAQIVSKAAQTEMRIGLNTLAFGSVEVRTTVHANDVGILIGSEKGDLHSLIANELPGIANTLQQQNLRLNQVNFQQGGFAFSGNLSSGGDSQPRYFSSATPFDSSPAVEANPDDIPSILESVGSSSTSLSILA
jgi:flagellar hook-length control protein FliK